MTDYAIKNNSVSENSFLMPMGILQWESQWDVSFKLIKKEHTKEKWMEMINWKRGEPKS